MRAWRLNASGVELTEAADPAARAGWAVVRPRLSALGGSDVRTVQRGQFKGTLGHEFVGVVEALDADDEQHGVGVGQRVTAHPGLPCGACDLCTGGLSQHCRKQRLLGRVGADGCLADLVLVPVSRLVPVPDAVDDQAALFAQSLGAAVHAARLVTLEAQSFVTILGDGVLGLLAAQVMAARNATVRVLTDDTRMLELCTKLGLRHRETTLSGLRADQDLVVVCGGTAGVTAFGMVRPRGRVIQAAEPTEPVDLNAAWVSEVQLLCSDGCDPVDAVSMLSDGAVRTDGLIERTVDFAQAGDALALAARPGALKIAVRHG